MDDPTDRLIRLLIADFRYKEAVDGTVWLDHARRENGRVIFYPDGMIVSIEHNQFDRIEIEETGRFNDFMRFIKPATRWERFMDWMDPVITTGCLILLLAISWGIGFAIHAIWKSLWET
ncbi:hypothetical protein ACVWZA_003416 [Sphingomonas sp. UYAg733]